MQAGKYWQECNHPQAPNFRFLLISKLPSSKSDIFLDLTDKEIRCVERETVQIGENAEHEKCHFSIKISSARETERSLVNLIFGCKIEVKDCNPFSNGHLPCDENKLSGTNGVCREEENLSLYLFYTFYQDFENTTLFPAIPSILYSL